MLFRINETTKLERPVTTITDKAITKAPFNWTVTANAEQIPKTNTEIGLPLKMGFNNNSL
jgi:hypothetical protein